MILKAVWNTLTTRYQQGLKWIGILGLLSLLLLMPACGSNDAITQIDPNPDAVSAVSMEPSDVDSRVNQLDTAQIDNMDLALLPRISLQGNIQRLPFRDQLQGFWTVNGVLVRVNRRTTLETADPLVGTPVTISGRQVSSDLIIATQIEDTAFEQVDRMGIPALLTVFIPPNPFEPSPPNPALEDAFNRAIPANDQRDFRGEIINTLEILFSLNDDAGDDPSDDAAQIQGLADVLLPDVLTVQLDQPTGFADLNGRNLEDDVIDVVLTVGTEGACTTDLVTNDSVFLNRFPYFGIANPL